MCSRVAYPPFWCSMQAESRFPQYQLHEFYALQTKKWDIERPITRVSNERVTDRTWCNQTHSFVPDNKLPCN